MDILIVDDHPIVRRGLKLLLEAEPGWRVVGLAAEGATAVSLAGEKQPAVAIVDLNLPDRSGLEVTTAIKERSPGTGVVILSMHMNEFYLKAARRRGASAYVSKHVAEKEIVTAVKAVLAGRTYPEQFGAEETEDAACGAGAAKCLSDRESEVLQLLAGGAQNKDVAQRLNISVRTAEKHRANIMRKLNLKNHAELFHYALQIGLIDLPKSVD